MDCMTEEAMTEYFDMLKFVLEKWIAQARFTMLMKLAYCWTTGHLKVVTKRGQKKV